MRCATIPAGMHAATVRSWRASSATAAASAGPAGGRAARRRAGVARRGRPSGRPLDVLRQRAGKRRGGSRRRRGTRPRARRRALSGTSPPARRGPAHVPAEQVLEAGHEAGRLEAAVVRAEDGDEVGLRLKPRANTAAAREPGRTSASTKRSTSPAGERRRCERRPGACPRGPARADSREGPRGGWERSSRRKSLRNARRPAAASGRLGADQTCPPHSAAMVWKRDSAAQPHSDSLARPAARPPRSA